MSWSPVPDVEEDGYLVDLALYNGSHLQSEDIWDPLVAKRTADYFRRQTMVERAIVIHLTTGEIRYDFPNIVAIWRQNGIQAL